MGLGFLGLYLCTLCPSTYLGDSGEIANAITTGGIIHPPGYPLYSLLGKLALLLIPIGEPAYRIGCLTAAAAAAAVAVLHLLARECGCSRLSALAGTTLFGAGYTFWSQSVRVEVYSLHVLLSLTVLLGAARYRRTGAPRDLVLAALGGGLGLAHHLTVVWTAPAAFLLAGRRLWTDPCPLRRWLPATLCIAAGPPFYLLLLLWSRAEPLYNWGRPATLPFLWNHVTAAIYRANLRLPDETSLKTSLPLFGHLFQDQFPYHLGLLLLPGLFFLTERKPAHGIGLALTALVVAAYNQCYRIPDIAPYYLVVWAMLAVLAAGGLDLLALLPGRIRWLRPFCWAAALGIAALPLQRNWSAADLSRATWVRDFARQKLECATRDAVLVSQWDPDTFPMWYVQNTLGVRRDVLIVDRSLIRIALWIYEVDPSLWYLHILRRQGAPIPLPATRSLLTRVREGDDGLLLRLIQTTLKDRPWCTTFARSPGAPAFDRQLFPAWIERNRLLYPQGVVIRLQPPDQPLSPERLATENQRLWSRISLPQFGGVRLDQDLAPGYVRDHYAAMALKYGDALLRAGRFDEAAAAYLRLKQWAPDYGPAEAAARWARLRVGG